MGELDAVAKIISMFYGHYLYGFLLRTLPPTLPTYRPSVRAGTFPLYRRRLFRADVFMNPGMLFFAGLG